MWHMDGTFKVVCGGPFKQLYTIASCVASQESVKMLPLVFIFMNKKRTEDYVEVLKAVLQAVNNRVEVTEII